MRKLLILLITGLLLAGGGTAAAHQYNKYQAERQRVQASAQKQAFDYTKALEASVAGLHNEYSTLHVECEKGLAAYGALSATVQKKLPTPSCGPVLPQ